MAERIQMSRQRPWRAEHPDAVIVARPSKWGNPHRIGEPTGYELDDGTSIDLDAGGAVIMFESLIKGDGLWWDKGDRHLTRADVRAELAGRDLACWCKPGQPCHADVLLAIAAGAYA